MAENQKPNVRNPVNVFMKEDTFNILSENETMGEVIAGLNELKKELKTQSKIDAKLADTMTKYVDRHLVEAKGLEKAFKDPGFRKKPGSYRFASETADKLTTTIGKTITSVTGKISDTVLKDVTRSYKIIDATNRAIKGVPVRDLVGKRADYYKGRYEFKQEHMDMLLKDPKDSISKFASLLEDRLKTAMEVQENRDIGQERKDAGVEKAERLQAELQQKAHRHFYMLGGGGGGGGGGTPIPEDGDGGGGGGGDEDASPPFDPETFDFDEVMNKITITAKDVANALAKEVRRDAIREALEKTDYMINKRESERKEKEKALAEKEAAKRAERDEKARIKHLIGKAERDLFEKGLQFQADLLQQDMASAEEESINARKKSIREAVLGGALVIGKAIQDIFNKFFNRTATEVSKSILSFLDDPVSAFLNHMEYAVNSLAGTAKKGGMGLLAAGSGMASVGGAVGSDAMMGMGKALGGIGAAVAIIGSVLQGAINAGLGVAKAIYAKLVESSPILQGFLKMFKTAVNLIFMPIGNILGTFFMMFGMKMINFAVWFNQEFPKYKYAIIGYITLGIASMLKVFTDFSMLFSQGLRALASLLGVIPGMSGPAGAIKGMAVLIEGTRGPLTQLASDLFATSNAAFAIQQGITEGTVSMEEAEGKLSGHLIEVNESLDNVFEEVKKITDELLKEQHVGWADRQIARGEGSFWRGLGQGFIDYMTSPPETRDQSKFRGYAHGGYIPASPGGTVIRAGEGTRGEWIIPDGRGSFGSSVVVNIEIKGDLYGDEHLKRTIERTVRDSMNRWNTL